MKFSRKSVVFSGIRQVDFQKTEIELSPSKTGILFAPSYSCVSAGTELAKLTGLQKVDFPLCLGNRAVGRVVEVGESHTLVKKGDLILAHAAHTSVAAYDGFCGKLPEEADRPEAALLGMGLVALTGAQQVAAQVGDTAVVTGAGLVGNLTAQLLKLSGVRVIIVDQVPERLAVAKACGIPHCVSGTAEEITRQVLALTDGVGAEFGLECTGVPAVVRGLPAMLARRGHMVMVGSPRGESGDMTAFLNSFHLWQPHGDLTLSGAHEWKIPPYPVPFVKHSMARNLSILCRLMIEEKLLLTPLTQVFAPSHAADAYKKLEAEKNTTLGVVFDWTR